jgi:hypothetical protein
VLFTNQDINDRKACWESTTLPEFSKRCRRWSGNDSFHSFAKEPQKYPQVASTEEIACFPNHLDKARDWLCIFRDFSVGQTSIEAMKKEMLEKNLKSLFLKGWELRQKRRGIPLDGSPEYVCFHKNGAGSVQWTHAHMFKELPAPDGMDLNGADVYCVGPLKETDISAAAKAAAHDLTSKVMRNQDLV